MIETGNLLNCPFKPEFEIGDIVEVIGEYAGDWRGVKLIIGAVEWNRKKNCIEYGTYDDNRSGLTTSWREQDLSIVTRATKAQKSPAELTVDQLVQQIKNTMPISSMQLWRALVHGMQRRHPDGIKIIDGTTTSTQEGESL